jgi:hypothetical protein
MLGESRLRGGINAPYIKRTLNTSILAGLRAMLTQFMCCTWLGACHGAQDWIDSSLSAARNP